MNKIINLIVAMAALTFCFSCNNEWEDEQFAHYVGFKAPINSDGCTTVYVRYHEDGSAKYQLPLVVSGSTVHGSNIKAVVELDADSLQTLNIKNIGELRKDIWYQNLADNDNEYIGKDRVLTEFPATVNIPAGESTAMLDIDMDLGGLDQTWRWILPLKVAENQPGYTANTRKHYNNALLHIVPFNEYSGTYAASTIFGYAREADGSFDMKKPPLVAAEKVFYATGANTAFFYAGNIDHTYKQRADYRINVTFNDLPDGADEGVVEFTCDNPEIQFSVEPNSNRYKSFVRIDDTKTYLEYRYKIVEVKYYMLDKTGGVPTYYMFTGSMTMQRAINNQIPDEDQAIQW